MKPLRPLIRTRQFWCETCDHKEPMTPEQFKTHLSKAHGLDGKVTGRKSLRSALDMAAGEYSNTFDWTLPGNIKVTEVSEGHRK